MGLGSGKNIFRILDPVVKKAPDPGSGSATLSWILYFFPFHSTFELAGASCALGHCCSAGKCWSATSVISTTSSTPTTVSATWPPTARPTPHSRSKLRRRQTTAASGYRSRSWTRRRKMAFCRRLRVSRRRGNAAELPRLEWKMMPGAGGWTRLWSMMSRSWRGPATSVRSPAARSKLI